MKFKKRIKLLLCYTLSLSIFIQSFFSTEIPAFADTNNPLLSSEDIEESILSSDDLYGEEISIDDINYIDDEQLNDAYKEGVYEYEASPSDAELYDAEGVKLTPLSPEAIAMLENGNNVTDLEANSISTNLINSPRIVGIDTLIIGLMFAIGAALSAFGMTRKFGQEFYIWLNRYSLPNHTSTFTDVDFIYNDSTGFPQTVRITAEMVDRFGEAINSLDTAPDPWNTSLALSNSDKLVLAYQLYKQGFLLNLSRSNIRVTHSSIEPDGLYPYYILASGSGAVKQLYFDKLPTGSFYYTSSYGMDSSFYDYDGNKIVLKKSSRVFYHDMKPITLEDGTKALAINYCNVVSYDYKLNSTTGFYENTNKFLEFKITESNNKLIYDSLPFPSGSGDRSFPFNEYLIKPLYGIDLYKEFYPVTLSSPDLDYVGDVSIRNLPRYGSISDFIDTVPSVITTNKDINGTSIANLYGTTTFLNPTGVMTRTGVLPTVAPTEGPTVDESGGVVTPTIPDGGEITGGISSILGKLIELLDWLKVGLSPSAFATAIATSLGLTALFQTITNPLSDISNWLKNNLSPSAIASAVAISLGLDLLFKTISTPLSSVLSKLGILNTISNTLDNIGAWDIDV